ncbi:hypothetical protein FA15DRAFT_611999 [Coprinopsis marcescibilis]|uniref:COP9 signalosome complex subunit 3 n=1 Tax=Coprinopsis marcescibilis TaxID=230819 RepID=A0A5C3L772_COPMA|nr:hypothetical protein FA15DRAFT_611999 [Coprinopsis marcescibilis]
MAPTDPLQIMDGILQHVTTASNSVAVEQYLSNLSPKDLRETALASTLSSGQDPLSVLHLTQNTLAVLYILGARLTVNNAQPLPFDLISDFCQQFNPEQARLAPKRVTILARGINRLAASNNNPRSAILPLYNLLRRYAPDLSYLTTIHQYFTLTCLQARHPVAALDILSVPITNIETSLSDLTYNDNLIYHYTGGIALALLRKWAEAEEFFEICVTAPGSYPAALQMEALKKLKLVQLISKGKTSSLPKYTHPLLIRQFKSTPYQSFVNSYPHNVDALQETLHRDRNTFAAEKNVGLLRQAIERAPRWALKKLTATYLSLNLADIGKAVKIDSEDEVRAVLLSMIEEGDISATISADDSVTFSDPPPQFTRAQVDQILRDVQSQSGYLDALEKDMAKSKEYLSKAVKGKDGDGPGGGWVGAPDEDVFGAMGSGSSSGLLGGVGSGVWDEINFA